LKALFLVLVGTFLSVVGVAGQALPAYGYGAALEPRNDSTIELFMWVHEGGRIDLTLNVYDAPYTGQYQSFYGVATNKANGWIIGKFPGRGRLRAKVNADGISASGRLRMLGRDGENLWFSRRVALEPLPYYFFYTFYESIFDQVEAVPETFVPWQLPPELRE
jgi:hypothetical protein